MSRQHMHLNILISSLTRRRPEMLSTLLRSFAQMQMPENCTVAYMIVENDTEARSVDVVRAAEPLLPNGLHYVLETELGIPFGRNRAAKEAIAMGADLLLFVDDDEETAEDWLVRIIAAFRASDAVLLGGPVRAKPPGSELTFFQRKMFGSIDAFYKGKEDRANGVARSDAKSVRIATNNWLAHLSIFRDHNIWFDEGMRFSGGTDSRLYAQVRDRGLPTGWVPDAIVYETISPDRLTFAYQFRRSRAQANIHARHKTETRNRSAAVALLPVLPKCIKLAGQVLLFPLTGGSNLSDIARSMGWIAGRISFVKGRRASLYESTTGQ